MLDSIVPPQLVTYIVNSVRMQRSAVKGALLIAENPEDGQFFQYHLDHEAVILPSADRYVREILGEIDKSGCAGVACSVRTVEIPPCDAHRAFRPSAGSTTALLIESDAAPRIVQDIFGVERSRIAKAEFGGLIQQAIRAAELLRKVQSIRAQVKPSEISAFFEWEDFKPDINAMQRALELPAEFHEDLRAVMNTETGSRGVRSCDADDVLEVLAIASAQYAPRGIRAVSAVGRNEILRTLRSSISLDQLAAEPMFRKIRAWERYSGYRLLSDWRLREQFGVVLDQSYWEPDLSAILQFGDVAALQMDLDHFKEVNSTLGQAGGDDGIRLYSTVVRDLVGRMGDVYRRGGDEIVVLAPGIDLPAAMELAERIRTSVAEAFRRHGMFSHLPEPPTVSVGVTIGKKGSSAQTVISALDTAQLAAKRGGRNRVEHIPTVQ